MITVDRSGTFGNNVWQYAIARTLSENIGMKLKFIDSNAHQWMSDVNRFPDADFPDYMKSSWIRGLPNTKMEIDGNVVDESINESVLLDNKNNLFSVSQNTNIKIPIHFENYDYIKHNKEKFKEWFKVDSKITPRIKPEPNDVVLSIRRGWAGYPESLCPPHEYFSKLLKKIDYERIIICTESGGPNFGSTDPYWNNFLKEVDAEIIFAGYSSGSHSILEQFETIRMAKKIVLTASTFCWWGAYLSDAQEIYYPWMEDLKESFVYDEDRYICVTDKTLSKCVSRPLINPNASDQSDAPEGAMTL